MTEFTPEPLIDNFNLDDNYSRTWDSVKTYSEDLEIDDGDITGFINKLLKENFELSETKNFDITRELLDSLESSETKNFDIARILSDEIDSDDGDEQERVVIVSTRGKFISYSGTYQQIIDNLDLDGVPEHKVKGFAFTSAGKAIVLVHRH